MKTRRSAKSAAENGVVRYYGFDTGRVAAAPFTPQEQCAIDAINRRIGGRESLTALLDFLADELRPIAPCDRFSLAFVEDEGRRVRSYYTKAYYEPLALTTGYTETLAGSTLEAILKRATPRVIADLQRYHELNPQSYSTQLLLKEGVRSSLTCPLLVDDQVIGLLFRSSREPNAYDDHQVMLQMALVERLAQAVEKAYRIERLAEANRAYNEMLAFVTHELRAPLASMLTDANLLIDGYLGELAPPQLDRIRRLVAKGQHLMTLIHDYLELARLEGGQLQLDARAGLDFVFDVLRPAFELVAADADTRRMRFERDIPYTLPPVQLDPKLLRIALVNLLSNAVKYGNEGGEIHLTVAHNGDSLRVAIRNEGPGFTPDQRNKLFRRFSRLSSGERARQIGSGVGLYTTWRIVQLHGGRIDARSEPGQWAEFTIEIPQPLETTLPPRERA